MKRYRLTESRLRGLIREAVKGALMESNTEFPEVIYCDSSERDRETRYGVTCIYGQNLVMGYFGVDYLGYLLWNSEFQIAPFDEGNKIVYWRERHKLSKEESKYICDEILRSGQARDYEAYFLKNIEDIPYMIP